MIKNSLNFKGICSKITKNKTQKINKTLKKSNNNKNLN